MARCELGYSVQQLSTNVRDCVYVCTTARWPVPWELGCEFVSELSASSESNRIANVCENKIL